MVNKINFLSNNVKGLQSTNKRLKFIKYFKDKIVSNGFLFRQETHTTVNGEIRLKDDFKGEVIYSHGSVLICFIGSKKLFIRNKILINLYNPKTAAEQLLTLSKLTEMLAKLDQNTLFKIIT